MGIIEKALAKANVGHKDHHPSQPPKQGPLTGQQTSPPASVLADVSEQRPAAANIIALDWKKLGELGFLTPGAIDTQAVEEYRNIKRPLLDNAFGPASVGIKRSNLILVTSSIPGEGKTFNAINIAISIANERDKQVLLIDADVPKSSIARTLGVSARYGLIDFLESDQIGYADIKIDTDLPGLSLITAGKQHKFSTELLSSNKMAAFTAELSVRYKDRVVIFDSPPLLAATQADVLARLVGQVVFVVEAERTLQSMIRTSVEKLASCDVVLVLMNKAVTGSVSSYYGGHYGYGYGYGQYAPKR